MPMRNENLTSKQIISFRDEAFMKYFSSLQYQNSVGKIFGQNIVDFINNEVLTKKIVRI
ncbi:MAG: hypothetical protein US50_C0043G0008 [Candidatus Nomurabacteria bacterium GW2011_GWB1_37_5]|uniref:Uncharacterized protein n=1 Tax=Candidatus Nomurabacteria bacterium GW2011_GWB1_37_5 TaxID=1618742 RepID=A0A0G0K1N8_9BACT|nr:MAG: hypothetical protein US50_C0043G0008 [Candidatus Nomurabacteria bacterium GW2011_GWB1_37_5]